MQTRRSAATMRGLARSSLLTALLALATVAALTPLAATVTQAFITTDRRSGDRSFGLDSLLWALNSGQVFGWLGNSFTVSAATVVVTVVLAAPAGYVLSRARGRWVSGFALAVFVLQALPTVMLLVPLFIVFAGLGLVDSLPGVTIIDIGSTLAVATWMMAAYTDSIPVALEEAAWLDGCSLAVGYLRVVLRNSLPALLSTAIFAFLAARNDYLVGVVFLRSDQNLTLGIAIAGAHVPALAVIMMTPPVLIFALLNRWFRLGGVAGALAGV